MGETPAEPPIVVVGAGAAGCMAAIFAGRNRRPVLLLERTRDGGRKILISGGGRCNILPSELDLARFVTASSRHTLHKILRGWPLAAQRRFFESELDLPLVLEAETGKLFPASNKARDVRDRLLTAVRDSGGVIRFDSAVAGIRPEEGERRWRVELVGGERIMASAVILATGGLSVAATGSDGIGLRIARELQHTVHETYPALTPLIADPPIHATLAGVSLPVQLKALAPTGSFTTRGGFLFTHHGYSGPAVLDISHCAVRSRMAGGDPVSIRVRWTADSGESWERRLTTRGSGTLHTTVRAYLPARLAERLLVEAGIDPGQPMAQLRRDERRHLIRALTDYELPWTGDDGYKKAEVTGGGVALAEVNPLTMESRIRPGLYLSGEMLDAFGPIGGYNFVWAWVTGRAAGLGAGSA